MDQNEWHAQIFCTYIQEGFHRWPSAPDIHAYLRNRHRHLFHFRVELQVEEADREIEFIEWKRDLQSYTSGILSPGAPDTFSCELLAQWVGNYVCGQYPGHMRYILVEVSEDGENGAVVWRVT